jgi:hypothetical protein
MMKLLTTGNPKIAKGEKLGYLTSILHLAPARLSGYQVCPMATKGCAFACLNTAGRGGIIKKGETTNVIQKARIRKTQWFFEDRQAFMAQLYKEIQNTIKLAEKHGLIPVFRLNGTSDIRWETVEVFVRNRAKDVEASLYPNIMSAFPTVQFYDYTKIPNRKNLPSNYHLTFSLAEDNDLFASAALKNGMNVAAVFRTIPDVFMGKPVFNGDTSDLRFLDPSNVIVGLKAKGKAKKDVTGFVRN